MRNPIALLAALLLLPGAVSGQQTPRTASGVAGSPILESELHRFVRFNWDVVRELAGRK